MSVFSGLFFWALMLALPKTSATRRGPIAFARVAGSGAQPSSSGGAPGVSATGSATGNEPTRVVPEAAVDPAAPPTYSRDIAQLFVLRCVRCHGSPFARNDLRLSSYADVMRGGETGTAVLPADPEGSLLLKKVEGRDKPSMPPRRRLSKPEKELLRKWIAAGAPP